MGQRLQNKPQYSQSCPLFSWHQWLTWPEKPKTNPLLDRWSPSPPKKKPKKQHKHIKMRTENSLQCVICVSSGHYYYYHPFLTMSKDIFTSLMWRIYFIYLRLSVEYKHKSQFEFYLRILWGHCYLCKWKWNHQITQLIYNASQQVSRMQQFRSVASFTTFFPSCSISSSLCQWPGWLVTLWNCNKNPCFIESKEENWGAWLTRTSAFHIKIKRLEVCTQNSHQQLLSWGQAAERRLHILIPPDNNSESFTMVKCGSLMKSAVVAAVLLAVIEFGSAGRISTDTQQVRAPTVWNLPASPLQISWPTAAPP